MSAQLSPAPGAQTFIPQAAAPAGGTTLSELREPLSSLVGRLDERRPVGAIRHVFSTLDRLLAELQGVRIIRSASGTLEETLTTFFSVRGQALDLVAYMEAQALEIVDDDEALAETLVSLSFAIRHELRRVFELDLVDLEAGQPPRPVQGKVAHAYELLRNCFQQCTVLLAQGFDPGLDGSLLFDDPQARLEQSVVLEDALSSLADFVSQMNTARYPEPSLLLVERLEAFRRESMQYLMCRDWEEFEQFVGEFVAVRSEEEFESAVKRFLAYLETLLGHVRMRTVLIDSGGGVVAPSQGTPSGAPAVQGGMGKGVRFTLAAVGAGVALAGALLVSPRLMAGDRSNARQVAESRAPEGVRAETVPAPQAPPQPAAAAQDTPSQGKLSIQVGAYRDAAAAAGMVSRMKSIGIDARVEQADGTGRGALHRVRLGRFGSEREAVRFGKKLVEEGASDSFIVVR